MPEWPEMETYRRLLSPLVSGQIIANAVVHRDKTINEPPETFASALSGRRILYVERRGKHLLFHLDDGYRLLLHLMLGGYLHYGANAPKEDEHYQVILTFGDGNRLFFGGLRLGFLHRLSAKIAQEQLRALGPDPFDARLTQAAFKTRLAKRRGKLKPVLVDQKFVSGIGNCYGDEICFEAGVKPDAAIPQLAEETKDRLYLAMREVLTEAAANGGYMDRPLTQDDTLTGGHDARCKVYDREGEACPRCGGTIRLETLAGRKMFYCPDCQRDG
ncbi:bifunctional DNA-formamidopyrimidine glycosylase/DNA-(apurinic or apyrimidinic site) lyase [Cohnella nanjingensis]|uniref:Formamidopyrimidine-DNA glycosylase n=1 Tax=Cohnella nanjingensis TaxID=1387779 RepID=A0A7X0VCQ5_9BACL|nr:bifunctional DNA-formamidopyrimidine glycosylase/DNA-(apurinic or apyrimidinic site) lyase [Cohnella nanjingensis]MBB6669172.1 bifunctional DNA-formamidopyrimidine glycosylase/DNA-(apurinic or apyrimidinic site) lyase [Cohnella nanjingensis]